jgi:ABC-type Fe3+ transport system permease subunit
MERDGGRARGPQRHGGALGFSWWVAAAVAVASAAAGIAVALILVR